MSYPKTARKKPVVVEVFKVPEFNAIATVGAQAWPEKLAALVRWGEGNIKPQVRATESDKPCVAVTTLDSTGYAFPGDYIIKGTKGEFYPCEKGVFEDVYEKEPK